MWYNRNPKDEFFCNNFKEDDMMRNYVRYITNYTDAPAKAEYIFRRIGCDGILQKYSRKPNGEVFVEDLFLCLYEDYCPQAFSEMITLARENMPPNKVLYIERPGYMYSEAEVASMEEAVASMEEEMISFYQELTSMEEDSSW